MNVVKSTNFSFPEQTSKYEGKVRDMYTLNNKYLIMVVTDRISAFDRVLPKGIPYKGQILNQLAATFLDYTKDILENWKIATPDPNVTIGRLAEPFKIEMVIRGYLTGHAWREYKKGKRTLCGNNLPNNLKENQQFTQPIITPTTKATSGHDMDITPQEILDENLATKEEYELLENYTGELFKRGTRIAAERGLILVDTKYEFGKIGDKIILIDEINTPDSSRYFYKKSYQKCFEEGLPQQQLSKEFVREWLMSRGFQGEEGQKLPDLDDTFIHQTSKRYIRLYETITGKRFVKENTRNISERIEKNILKYLQDTLQ